MLKMRGMDYWEYASLHVNPGSLYFVTAGLLIPYFSVGYAVMGKTASLVCTEVICSDSHEAEDGVQRWNRSLHIPLDEPIVLSNLEKAIVVTETRLLAAVSGVLDFHTAAQHCH